MKKEYIKPEIAVEEFITEVFMNNTSGPGSVTEGDGEHEGEYESNSHRGSWGNLWD